MVLGGVLLGAAIFATLTLTLRFDHPFLSRAGVSKPDIIGFLPYWLIPKADGQYGRFLTTLTYFGLALDRDGKPVYLAKPGEEEPGWTALRGEALSTLRKKTASAKQSLLVHSADDEIIAGLLAEPVAHATVLVDEVGQVMAGHGFTDLNLDIESFSESTPAARAAYTEFVRTVKTELTKRNLGTLTVEIPPVALFTDNLADPAELGKIADTVVLMTYDYHYSGSFLAGPVAPLRGAPDTRSFDVETAVAEAVRVIPPNKLRLGIPLYGYEWETVGEATGSATIPGGASTASSRRVAELLSGCSACVSGYDPVAGQPFVTVKEEGNYAQIYYENERSLKEKVDLASRYGLGGVALWALGYEDPAMLTPLSLYKTTVRWNR